MNQRKIILCCIFFALFFMLYPKYKALASVDAVGSHKDIGRYDSGSYSYPGVMVALDGEPKYYALDTWSLKNNNWELVGTNYGGAIKAASPVFVIQDPGSPVSVVRENAYRFGLDGKAVLAEMPSDYSLVYREMKAGSVTDQGTSYSFEDHSAAGGPYSIYKDSLLELSDFQAYASSFLYEFYTPTNLVEAEKVTVNIPEEAYYTSFGKAYVTENGYYIEKLPEAVYTKRGYDITFEGWFDKESGGSEIKEKMTVPDGTMVYGRWSVIPKSYTVTCFDIFGTDPGGTQLNRQTWKALQGETVAGSKLGTDTREGAYYENYVYRSCTEAAVYLGATVYRFFSYPDYEVTYIDQIAEGTKIGSSLGVVKQQKELYSDVSGADLGDVEELGEYYKGYVYSGSTSARVTKEGATVYRYFKPHHYTVRFDGNGNTGGTMNGLSDCRYGEEFSLHPNSFQKEIAVHLNLNTQNASCKTSDLYVSQKFLGWSLKPDGSLFYGDGASVSNLADQADQVTLYAVWSEEKVNVDVTPEKQGYRFIGWSTDPDGIKGQIQFTLTGDTELFAVWQSYVANYHVEYYKENTDGTFTLDSSYAYEGYSDQLIRLDTDKIIFQGYSLDKEASVTEGTVQPDGSLLLSLYFRRNLYTLSYELNGGVLNTGSLPASSFLRYGADVSVQKEPDAIKAGYTFAGWSLDKQGAGQLFAAGETIKMPNHDTVLYAVWKPVIYHIIYDANISETGNTTKKVDVTYETVIELPEKEFTRTGYTFSGWNTKKDASGISYAAGEKVEKLTTTENDTITLYACWNPAQVLIRYDSNPLKEMQATVTGTVADTTFPYDSEGIASNTIFYAQGYEMVNWNTKKDGTGITVKPGEKLGKSLFGGTEAVLYAIWKPGDHTKFTLVLYDTETNKERETLVLYGTTGEKISDAVKRIYAKTLEEDEVYQFYEGYEVSNKDILDQIIRPDGTTRLTCNLVTRNCKVSIVLGSNKGKEQSLLSEVVPYQGTFTLPKTLGDGTTTVDRYRDNKGNVYPAGENVKLEKNQTFYAQHLVKLSSDSEDLKETDLYVDHGETVSLPVLEKNGYQFLGWYDEKTNKPVTKEDLSSVTNGLLLYAKWSDPLVYRIIYDVEDHLVKILENQINSYQYGSETVLPDKMQVVTEEGYEFKGWYLADDPLKQLITKIPKEQYGDITLKAKISKKGEEVTLEQADLPKDSSGAEEKNQNETGQTEGNQTDSSGNTSAGDQNNIENASLDALKQTADITTSLTRKAFSYRQMKFRIISADKKTVKLVKYKGKKKSITIPAKVTYQGVRYTVTTIGKKAFYRNTTVRKLKISSSVRKIQSSAFQNMKNLKKATIGKKVTWIGKKAFYGNKKLRKITVLSKKIKTVKKAAFGKLNRKIQIIVPKQKKVLYQTLFNVS